MRKVGTQKEKEKEIHMKPVVQFGRWNCLEFVMETNPTNHGDLRAKRELRTEKIIGREFFVPSVLTQNLFY